MRRVSFGARGALALVLLAACGGGVDGGVGRHVSRVERGAVAAPLATDPADDEAGAPAASASEPRETLPAEPSPHTLRAIDPSGPWPIVYDQLTELARVVALRDGWLLHTVGEGTPHASHVRSSSLTALDRDLRPRWRVIVETPLVAVSASPDGARVLVLGGEESRVLSASDGSEIARLRGRANVGILTDDGRVVRAPFGGLGSRASVEIAALDARLLRRFPVVGREWVFEHTMMLDGECVESEVETTAQVTSLAGAHGFLAIGVSDGSIRIHRERARGSRERRLVRSDVPVDPHGGAHPIALSFVSPEALIAVYGDGAIVRWDPATGTQRATVPGPCSAEELAALTAIPGIPRDALDCGGSYGAEIQADEVLLRSSNGSRLRTLDGTPRFATRSPMTLGSDGARATVAAGELTVSRSDGSSVALRRGPLRARVVDLSETHVAVDGLAGRSPLGLFRIVDGVRMAGFDDAREVRLVGARAVVRLPAGDVVVRGLGDARELARVSTSPAHEPRIVRAGRGALVIAERVLLVTRGEIRDLGRGPPLVPTSRVLDEDASADGELFARVSREPDAPAVLEVFAGLRAGAPRRVLRVEDVGEDVALREDGAELVVSGTRARLFELPSGRERALPESAAHATGFDVRGRACLADYGVGTRCVEAGALVAFSPLSCCDSIAPVAERTVLLGEQGPVLVLDPEGRALAHVAATETGFAITTPEGLLAASPDPPDDLYLRQGWRALPLSDEAARPFVLDPARWYALVRPSTYAE